MSLLLLSLTLVQAVTTGRHLPMQAHHALRMPTLFVHMRIGVISPFHTSMHRTLRMPREESYLSISYFCALRSAHAARRGDISPCARRGVISSFHTSVHRALHMPQEEEFSPFHTFLFHRLHGLMCSLALTGGYLSQLRSD